MKTVFAVWLLPKDGGVAAYYGLHPNETAAEDFIARHMRLSLLPRSRYDIEETQHEPD